MTAAKFGLFSGLADDPTTAAEYCGDAWREVALHRDDEKAGGEEALSAYAAALAYYRYVLAGLSGSCLPRVGQVALFDSATLSAARELLEQYRAGAAHYLLSSGVAIRQVQP